MLKPSVMEGGEAAGAVLESQQLNPTTSGIFVIGGMRVFRRFE